jgi:hypothetical protein
MPSEPLVQIADGTLRGLTLANGGLLQGLANANDFQLAKRLVRDSKGWHYGECLHIPLRV